MWARPGAYPRVEHLIGSSIGWAPAFPTNIRLRWKGFPRANTLAYWKNSKLMAVKSFITLAPDRNAHSMADSQPNPQILEFNISVEHIS